MKLSTLRLFLYLDNIDYGRWTVIIVNAHIEHERSTGTTAILS